MYPCHFLLFPWMMEKKKKGIYKRGLLKERFLYLTGGLQSLAPPLLLRRKSLHKKKKKTQKKKGKEPKQHFVSSPPHAAPLARANSCCESVYHAISSFSIPSCTFCTCSLVTSCCGMARAHLAVACATPTRSWPR